MSLENFYSSLRDSYLEENERQNQIENKAHKFLLISSVIVAALQFLKLDFDWIVLIPTPIILIFFVLLMRIQSFAKPLDVDYFLTKNNEICEETLEKTKKFSKEEFLNDRIKSYIRCTSKNKKINENKAKFTEIMQYFFISQIGLLIVILFFNHLSFDL
ncbi:hypothetical protein K0U27_10630 [archaeon]|nr:hypothetical protein [archaeon]